MSLAPVLLSAAVLCAAAGSATVLRGPRRSHDGGSAMSPESAARSWVTRLEHMAAEVRTGASLSVAHHAATGLVLAHRSPSASATDNDNDDEALAMQAIISARTLGGPVAATLDAAADTLRERTRLRHEARAHSAPARLSAVVLTAVPVVFCAWNLLTSASFRAAWFSPVGLVAAGAGTLCNLAGWWWMRRIIAKATP